MKRWSGGTLNSILTFVGRKGDLAPISSVATGEKKWP